MKDLAKSKEMSLFLKFSLFILFLFSVYCFVQMTKWFPEVEVIQ